MRRTSASRKLAGWGILAVAALLIVGIFLISRLGAPARSSSPLATTSSASSAAPSSAQASSAPVASPPAASSEAASVSSQPVAPPASSAPPSSEPGLRVIDPAAMDQDSRKALLNALIDQGIFTGIEAVGSPPKVGVTQLFLGLNPSLQQQFIGLVYAYVNNGAAGTVPLQIIDATTGKTIESFTAAAGLKTP